MNYLLLDLAAFTVGANSLIVRAVLLTIPLYLDRSYVDDVSPVVVFPVVVFILNTTYTNSIPGRVSNHWLNILWFVLDSAIYVA